MQSGRESGQRSAYDVALGLLARREQSRRELRLRLEQRGYDSNEVEAALERLAAGNYQNDARFGEMLVRTRVAQGYGPSRLRAELRSHDLPDGVIRHAIEAQEVDWVGLAHAQLIRHYHGTPAMERNERVRRMQYLQRRGFDATTIRLAVDMDGAGASGDNA